MRSPDDAGALHTRVDGEVCLINFCEHRERHTSARALSFSSCDTAHLWHDTEKLQREAARVKRHARYDISRFIDTSGREFRELYTFYLNYPRAQNSESKNSQRVEILIGVPVIVTDTSDNNIVREARTKIKRD